MKQFQQYLCPDEKYVIGFLDESSPQTKANTQRLWAFKKSLMIKNTDYIKANAFAFYSINGNNLIDFKESSKAESVCEFLEKIVEENKGKIIVLILDNSKAHKADKTIAKAKELGINTCVSSTLFTRSKSCRIYMENN